MLELFPFTAVASAKAIAVVSGVAPAAVEYDSEPTFSRTVEFAGGAVTVTVWRCVATDWSEPLGTSESVTWNGPPEVRVTVSEAPLGVALKPVMRGDRGREVRGDRRRVGAARRGHGHVEPGGAGQVGDPGIRGLERRDDRDRVLRGLRRVGGLASGRGDRHGGREPGGVHDREHGAARGDGVVAGVQGRPRTRP